MINTNYGATPIRPSEPRAAHITHGVHHGNIDQVASNLAQDSATVTRWLDGPQRTDMAKDVQALKTQLWARLGDQQMATALMTAGAIMGGPPGVTMQNLSGTLKSTVASKEKMDQLAQQVERFHQPVEGESKLGDDVYKSLNTRVTRDLAAAHVPPSSVPVALFISGAMANSYADQGGLAQQGF